MYSPGLASRPDAGSVPQTRDGLQGGGRSFCRPSRDCGITGRSERAETTAAGDCFVTSIDFPSLAVRQSVHVMNEAGRFALVIFNEG